MRRFIFRNTIFGLCVAVLAACMYMPAARDDFSQLGTDPFSTLIREGRFDKGDANTGRIVGFGMLDREKLTKLSRELFAGKTKPELTEFFEKYEGKCDHQDSSSEEKFLVCWVERRWKLKNIGTPVDMSNWADPAVKLRYKFLLPRPNMIDFELEIVDITVHRPFKG